MPSIPMGRGKCCAEGDDSYAVAFELNVTVPFGAHLRESAPSLKAPARAAGYDQRPWLVGTCDRSSSCATWSGRNG